MNSLGPIVYEKKKQTKRIRNSAVNVIVMITAVVTYSHEHIFRNLCTSRPYVML